MSAFISKIISIIKYIITGTDMGYTSFVFIGCLVVFFIVFFLLHNKKLKVIWILIANLVFYVWAGSIGALLIIAVTALIVYIISRVIEKIYVGFEKESKDLSSKEKTVLLSSYKKKTRIFVILAVFVIVAVWVYVKICKYLDFETVNTIRSFKLLKSVIVPLGISYYSLSSIGYLFDIYWRKARPEHNFVTFVTVMTYFPHIVQGPISKYHKLTEQMNNLPKFDYNRFCYGMQLMLWGYIKKMVIADRLDMYTSTVFASPSDYGGAEIFIAIVACTFQLYTDFSGCMDIVSGISQAMGIELELNFRQPLSSKSASDFWRRWHITLGAWMREYIYLPISTNPRFIRWTGKIRKKGKTKTAAFLRMLIPSIVVWFLTGIWHGTGVDYIVWGYYWCVLIVLSSLLKPVTDKMNSLMHIDSNSKGFLCWQSIRTSILFGIGRMFTVAGGLSGFAILWKQMFLHAKLWELFDGSIFTLGMDSKDFCVVIIGVIILLVVDHLHEKGKKIRKSIAVLPLPIRWIIYIGAIFAILIFGVYGNGYDAASFIYQVF